MNKLLSKDTNINIAQRCADIGNEAMLSIAEEKRRATGRTTAILLGLIAVCLANPGQTHRSSDHFRTPNGHYHDACRLQSRLEDLLRTLGMEHWHTTFGYKELNNGDKVAQVGLRFTFLEDENGQG